jgi:adenine-specific DNA methylase
MTVPYPKRLIEVDLPIKRISAHARREKSIRHGHISTLHIWWARRPLAACRAVILAALWPDPADDSCPEQFRRAARDRMLLWARDFSKKASPESFERLTRVQKKPAVLDDATEVRNCLLDFIADFANWDNSNDSAYLETSRALVQAAHEALGGASGTRPLLIDPFSGGGSIPLEALRVGADAFASDLNPVAVLLNRVVLQYIPTYGQRLADEVRKWGAWVKEQAEKELAGFYPDHADGATPIVYIWARTIRCEGPGCGAEVPLMRSLWLCKKAGRLAALRLVPDPRKKVVSVVVVDDVKPKNVGEGTVRRGSATCPVCGYTTGADKVRAQFDGRRGGAADARLIAVVYDSMSPGGRFREPTATDLRAVERAASALSDSRPDAYAAPSLSRVPNEPLPYLRSIFNIHLLGVHEWGDLFSPRQTLALTTFVRWTREARQEILKSGQDRDLADAITSCLALATDRGADYWSSLAVWAGEFVAHTFGRQALGIVWDYAEVNPVADGSGNYSGAVEWVFRYLDREAKASSHSATVIRASATEHPLPDDSAAAFVTDPPYYDAVPYADLSDFFYVWLRRMLFDVHPDLFSEQLTPKKGEVVQLAERNKQYAFKTREYFEDLMRQSMTEARRVLDPRGIGLVVFAHKTTVGWETQLQAMTDAGWVIVGSWPIDTERPGRLRANDAAALASSIHLVCRPREHADGSVRADSVGDWRDVLVELPQRIHQWMPRLAAEGVVGADAIFACLGPALEIFSRYSSVEKASGERVSLKEYLEQVWAAVAREALSMIFAGADTSGFEEDSRLTAMWLWTLSTSGGNGRAAISADEDDDSDDAEEDDATGKKASKPTGFTLEFDAARKIAQGLGIHLEALKSLVEVTGETARLLPVAERTRALFGKDESEAPTQRRKKKAQQMKLGFDEQLEEAEEAGGWGQKGAPPAGQTTLDRVHQSMILFAAGRGEALRRFLVDEGAGRDARFWRLAQALAALYPTGTDERRWVEGLLARKKGLGF